MSPAIGRVKALVFDVFGTVVDWRGSVIREGEALGRAKGVRLDWAAFAEEWRTDGYHGAIQRIRRGELPWATVDELHRRKLDELLPKHAVTSLAEAEIADFNRVWHRLAPWPDAVPGLSRLRARYTIAPLSNGNFALLTDLAKHAGLPWDCILSAELFGAYKSDPATYLGAARLLAVEPGELMMVAAHNGDLKAAQALGLATAFVSRPDEWGPGAARERAPDATFDVIARDFVDLAAQLGA